MISYDEFIRRKEVRAPLAGMDRVPDLPAHLFPHQRDTVEFLLRAGRGAAFLDTGLGKTVVELEYGRRVVEHTNRPVLMLSPLAVGKQHIREAERFGVDATIARDQSDVTGARVYVANYERLHLFDRHAFGGLILDESSIVKSFTGRTSRALMNFGRDMRWRLAATATPAPNDHMELGQHSQFLGAMDSSEMLARWFIADQSEMGRYRLKRHGVKPFWSWVASWARCVCKPSDLGYSDDGFELPPLNIHQQIVETDMSAGADGMLFRIPDTSATAIHMEKRLTANDRAARIAEIVHGEPGEQWMVWVETDYDADAIMASLPGAVEVRGSMRTEMKEERLDAFTRGDIRILVSKPSIAGFGLNWQRCSRTAFVGLSFSYEMFYQAVRRFWRFGQKRSVDCHVAMAETELAIWQTIQRKKADHEAMKREMFEAMRREVLVKHVKHAYQPTSAARLPAWLQTEEMA
ncbi:helicase-related protein [Pseudothauera rhizosphaerae]|uniref:Helicase n=1 Tax=Pseudothauera rhizosphaerae TaxID=2565932 RepID=A0A4S4AXI2_9RHOO|nr:DEAD/DEAH box helicase [Pseudothauera rhizosphaerae]THF64343.1 helicase [Pseudothauera rhizosphaerae]